MPQYIIYFNQQWVGDHTAEWFQSRGPLARAVMQEAKDAGVHIFSAGVDEDVAAVARFEPHGNDVTMHKRSLENGGEYLGGFALVDVADEEAAHYWAEKVAVACGWPQEVRRVY